MTVPPTTREPPLFVSTVRSAGHSKGEQEAELPPRFPGSSGPLQRPLESFPTRLEPSVSSFLRNQPLLGTLPFLSRSPRTQSQDATPGSTPFLWGSQFSASPQAEPQGNLPSDCFLCSPFVFFCPTPLLPYPALPAGSLSFDPLCPRTHLLRVRL